MTEEKRYNMDNFITMEDILKQAEIYSSAKTYTKIIRIEISNGLRPVNDVIRLVRIGNHCVVVLCLPTKDIAYAADGSNELMEEGFKREVLREVKLPLKGLKFDQQTHIDHCAASAAAICIEFKRCYSNISLLDGSRDYIRVEPSTLEKIKKVFYKNRSDKEEKGRNNIGNIVYQECRRCGKKYRTASRLQIVQHEKRCTF